MEKEEEEKEKSENCFSYYNSFSKTRNVEINFKNLINESIEYQDQESESQNKINNNSLKSKGNIFFKKFFRF